MKKGYLHLVIALAVFASIMAGGWYLWKGYVVQGFGGKGGLYLVFAFLAGAASFFAPCAFALLPGYASYYLGMDTENRGPAYIGIATAAGILGFYLLMGVLVSVFGAAVGPFFGYFKPAAGLLFLLLGTLLYTRSFYLGPFSTALGKIYMEQKEGGVLAFFLFGLAYGATALGCTLPIFLVLVIYPLFTGDVILGFLAFAAYSMAKALLMVGVTYLVAYSKDALVGTLAVSTGRIKRFSGAVIAAIGIYLISGGM